MLDFSMFYQLHKLIKTNWESFIPVFGKNAKRLEVWIAEAESVRDAIAHERPLTPHERDLLSGIAGQVRNQISIFRTNSLTANGYYPIIDSVRDNFGRAGISADSPGAFGVFLSLDQPAIRIDVGQKVTFECRGADPRDRVLTWGLRGPNMEFLGLVSRER